MDENDLVLRIVGDVMSALNSRHFFESLDNLLCPEESEPVRKCDHSYSLTTEIVSQLGFDSDDLADILAVLKSKGACCD